MLSTGELSLREALSGIFGSMSLASWILVLVPQLVENYKAKNAQGMSLAFLAVWFVGDLTNLIGAVWAALLPTAIALAFYFCLADAVLILQCLYYNYYYTLPSLPTQIDPLRDPRRPLLAQQGSNLGISDSRRRSSAASREQQHFTRDIDTPHRTLDKSGSSRQWLVNTASVVGVCIIGAVGWTVAWGNGLWLPIQENANREATRGPVGAEILGYVSAVCYLGARIPQMLKNYREKSCEGLSLLFFMLSLLGNATYGAGIICHSIQKNYLLTNLPWLIGSLGTMGEDVLIFIQFHVFDNPKGPA